MKAHALRIDLQAPGLEIILPPPMAPGATNYRSQFATDFIRRQDLAVAVSGGPFWPEVRWPGLAIYPVGVMVTDGVRWSPPVGNLHALVFTKDHRVRLSQDQRDLSDVWQEMGGNLIILQHGTNLMEAIPPTATSVVGHSVDGRILYWLLVDGRQPGWSEGASPVETAEMMKSLGATDALRMDGGSVVTLAKSGFLGAKVINRPSHPYLTGVQRPIGSFVGIRARPRKSPP
jgi:exopolysaccharide biosynthesis protein